MKLRSFLLVCLVCYCSINTLFTKESPTTLYYSVRKFFDKEEKGWQSLKKVNSVKKENQKITLTFVGNKTMQIHLLSDTIIRFRFNKDNQYTNDFSYAVIKKDFAPVDFTFTDNKSQTLISTGKLKLTIDKNPFKIEIFKDQIPVCVDMPQPIRFHKDNRILIEKKYRPDGYFFGFGEKTGPLNKNKSLLSMWNTDAYAYKYNTDPLYKSIPFFIEVNSQFQYGIFFDNTYQTLFDMGNLNEDYYSFGAANGEMNYYFISGNSVKDIITDYTALTGRLELPPRWALGYQQSRFSYFPESRVREIAKNFREKKIPCDILYLDIDFMEIFKVFTVNKNHFPDLNKMLNDLRAEGFKIVTIIDPGVKILKNYFVYEEGLKGNHFLKMPDGSPVRENVWPGPCHFPDFSHPETRDWWGQYYKDFYQRGIEGFWNDMNEPSAFNNNNKTLPLDAVHYDFGQYTSHAKNHNVYGLTMAQSTYEGLLKIDPKTRPFVLTRAGYAGMQRYGATWSGDNSATWNHLKMNLSMVINSGISGVPFSGPDIGGYSGTPTPELFIRWMQLGAFQPFYRNHTERGSKDQEPWAFGIEAETLAKKSIETRYKNLQLWYDLFQEASVNGIPPVRPLFLEYPNDPDVFPIEDQFLLGENLLVAPILKENMLYRKVIFPKDTTWLEWNTGKKYTGGTVEIPVELSTIPVFVKAGAIIPQNEVVQYVEKNNNTVFTLMVFPEGNSAYTLYQDDGVSLEYKNNIFHKTRVEHRFTAVSDQLIFTVLQDTFKPFHKELLIQYVYTKKPKSIMIGNVVVQKSKDRESLNKSLQDTYYYDEKTNHLWVKVNDGWKNQEILISFE